MLVKLKTNAELRRVGCRPWTVAWIGLKVTQFHCLLASVTILNKSNKKLNQS